MPNLTEFSTLLAHFDHEVEITQYDIADEHQPDGWQPCVSLICVECDEEIIMEKL